VDEFVERIRDRGYHRDQIRFRRSTPGRDPEPRPCEMDAGIADRLAGRAIDELHAHQVDAVGAVRDGRNFVGDAPP
jgi:DEAD/DEAH box helicase domain-containing protein